MSAHAHKFNPAPCQKCSGELAYAGGVNNASQTDRAALALIAESPAHAEEANQKR
jgi:hypothetical protein